ncbi:MAG: DUF3313 domain-containing protein [Psychrobium sp.]
MELSKFSQNTSFVKVAVVAFSLLLSACSSTPKKVNSGFLGDYSQLKVAPDNENLRTYQRDDFKLSNVKKIKVVPFEIWLEQTAKEPNLRVNTQQLAQLQQYFYQRLTDGLGKYYNLVEEADDETLIIRGAFSRIKLSKPSIGVTDFIPVRIVLNTGNSAYLAATNQQDLISEVSIESEFVLGADKERVFAVATLSELDVTVTQEKDGNLEAVTQVLDIWADNFIKKVAEIQLAASNNE